MTRHLVLLSGAAMLAWGQQPAITNADLRPASAANGLQAAIRTAASGAAGPAWIGYAAPAVPGQGNNSCCWGDNGRGCGLEGQRGPVGVDASTAATPVRLEGPSHVVILLRFEPGSQVAEKLRVFSPDCPLDAGGLPFYWLSNVKTAESVAMLTEWLRQKQQNSFANKPPDAAVQAIAMHAGPEAEAVLVKLADASQQEATRRATLFWLANSRGKAGFDVVMRAAREDTSEKVREHAIFALTQSKQPEAIPAIISIARGDKAPRVRKQAMFWLGRSQDRRALEFLEQVLSR